MSNLDVFLCPLDREQQKEIDKEIDIETTLLKSASILKMYNRIYFIF